MQTLKKYKRLLRRFLNKWRKWKVGVMKVKHLLGATVIKVVNVLGENVERAEGAEVADGTTRVS
jgi:hypothetical protein